MLLNGDLRAKYVPVAPPDVAGLKVVGLDTWVWRRLSSAARRGDLIDLDALAALQGAVDSRSIVVPLAATTYLEIQGINNFAIREETARLASRLSKWHTFESHTRVLEREIDRALNKLFGTPVDPAMPGRAVGWGAHYMFTGVSHGLRLVGDPAEVRAFLNRKGQTEETFLRDMDEEGQLRVFRGPPPGQDGPLREVHGYAPEKTWRVATERAARYRHMSAALAKDPGLAARPADLVDAAEFAVEIGEIVARRMVSAGLDIEAFLNEGKVRLTDFLDLMPSSVVRRTLLVRVLRDKNRPPTENDVNDADLFATLVPQSDLVIAEKAAHRALTGSEIISRYDVKIEKTLAAVPEALEELLRGSAR